MNAKESGGNGDVKESIRHFVTRSINFPDLGDDDDLFESGLVNSLFAIQLMTFIEKTFGVEVEADDLDIKNFRSLNAATSFVMKKSVASAS
jgi:acyl carrier protein